MFKVESSLHSAFFFVIRSSHADFSSSGKQSNSVQHPFFSCLNLDTSQNRSSGSFMSTSGSAASNLNLVTSAVKNCDYTFKLQSRYTANVNLYAQLWDDAVSFILFLIYNYLIYLEEWLLISAATLIKFEAFFLEIIGLCLMIYQKDSHYGKSCIF